MVATFFNLLSQRIVFALGDTNVYFLLAILTGTTVGLLIKYVLDEKFIFPSNKDFSKSKEKTFFLYTLTGIFTTFFFLDN